MPASATSGSDRTATLTPDTGRSTTPGRLQVQGGDSGLRAPRQGWCERARSFVGKRSCPGAGSLSGSADRTEPRRPEPLSDQGLCPHRKAFLYECPSAAFQVHDDRGCAGLSQAGSPGPDSQYTVGIILHFSRMVSYNLYKAHPVPCAWQGCKVSPQWAVSRTVLFAVQIRD